MFRGGAGLLLLLLPIYSFLNSGNRPRSTAATVRTVSYSNRQLLKSEPSATKLSDREDSSTEIDERSIFDRIDSLRLRAQFDDRADILKPERLLTKDWEIPNAIEDIRCYLAINDSFVPVIGVHKTSTFIKLRSFLFGKGVYPGVEYKILNMTILSDATGRRVQEVSSLQGLLQRGKKDAEMYKEGWIDRLLSGDAQLVQTGGGDSSVIIESDVNENYSSSLSSYREEEDFIELTIKPAYPLIRTLEKKWPVKVRLSAIPYVFSRASYTTVTLLGTLSFALSYFLAALLLSQVFTLSFVNSRSMTPTILPGDLILVEKISPILRRNVLGIPPANEGDIIFFSAPPRLLQYITESNAPVDVKIAKKAVGLSKSSSGSNSGSNSGSSSSSNIGSNIGSSSNSGTAGGKSGREEPNTSNNFDADFLNAQSKITSQNDVKSVNEDAIQPVPTANVERNPFRYSKLRPIGGNTLLVKRLQKISYPEVSEKKIIDDDRKGLNVIKSGVASSNVITTEETSASRSFKSGSREEKKGPVCLFVRGDNPDVSLDSRQWGCLSDDLVIGKPVLRVLPLKRFGFLK